MTDTDYTRTASWSSSAIFTSEQKVLPTDIRASLSGFEPKTALELAGVEFQAVLEETSHLQAVTLPDGWKIQDLGLRGNHRNEHANLLDERRRVRAIIRLRRYRPYVDWKVTSAHMIVACPFMLSFKRVDGDLVARVRKRFGGEVFRIKTACRAGESTIQFKERLRAALKAELSREFPQWQHSPFYWDM